jgi:hypothetical protein
MIKGDALLITKGGAPALLIDLISVPSQQLKQGVAGLISILCSTGQGILYLSKNQTETLAFDKFVDLMKDQDDGSVT